jgi:hypothetical protein
MISIFDGLCAVFVPGVVAVKPVRGGLARLPPAARYLIRQAYCVHAASAAVPIR